MIQRRFIGLISSILIAGSFAAACGDGETNNPSGTGGDGGSGTGGDGDATGGTMGGLGCRSGQKVCDDFCASVASDPQNCGDCGETCGTGEGCLEGACANFGCPTGQVACDDLCVSTQTDEENCGGCGNACAAGEMCLNGQCEPACTDAQLICGEACVDPQTDADFCGATMCSDGAGGAGGASSDGDTCSSGTVCVGGTCVNSCPANQLECGGKCIDPLTSAMYCGATDCSDMGTSGTECGDEQTCVIGECRNFVRKWNPAQAVSVVDWASGSNESAMVVDYEGDVIVMYRQFLSATPAPSDPDVMYVNHFDAQTKTWSGPRRLSTSSDFATTNPTLAVGTDGNAIAAWVEKGTPRALKVSRYTKSTESWTTPITLDTVDGAPETPSVGIDGSGNAHIVWAQDVDPNLADSVTIFRVFHSVFDAGTQTYSTPTSFSGFGESASSSSQIPRIAVNAAGDAGLIWRQTGTYPNEYIFGVVYNPTAKTWTSPVAQGTYWAAGATTPTQWTVTIDGDGNVYTAYNVYDTSGVAGYDIYASKYDNGTDSWGAAVELVDEAVSVLRPVIRSNSNGDLVLTYWVKNASNVDVVARRLTDAFALVESKVLSAGIGTAATVANPTPGIADDGTIHVVWPNGSMAVSSKYDPVQQSWIGPVQLNQSTPGITSGSFPVIAISPAAHAYAGWYGAARFYVARYD